MEEQTQSTAQGTCPSIAVSYLARERSFDRELEHSAEREMQYNHNFAFEHDRGREFERDDRSDRGREEDDRGSDFGRGF